MLGGRREEGREEGGLRAEERGEMRGPSSSFVHIYWGRAGHGAPTGQCQAARQQA